MQILDEAVVILDRGRHLVFANDAAARMFGFDSANELIGSPEGAVRERFDLYDEAGAPLAVEEFAPLQALRGEPAPPQIVRAISRDDERELWLRAKSKVVAGMDGEPLFAVTALEDVTEIKVAEFEQTLLARLGELHGLALDHEQMVERLTEVVIPQLADWCTIYDLRPDGVIEHLATAHGDAERLRKAREIEAEYPLSMADGTGPAEVLRSGEPMLIDDLDPVLERLASDQHHLELMRELGAGSAMMLPMRIAGSVIGALVLVNQADRRPFDQFDRKLGEKVAERAAVALENARLATERSEIARTLQQGLLPAPLPHIPGWSVAALYRPAGSENEVGGDFYDAFAYRSGWIFVLGDVTGRGARAALITALARYTLRTASALSGDPLVALGALNRALIAREDSSLCSVAAIAVGEDSSEVRIAVAGHPPPLLVGPEGVREAAGTGPVLGAFPDAEWELTRARLESGCHLVVYTDGVTEASGPEGRFGEERVRARLLGASSPVVAVQRLEEALEAFCRGNLEDDAAIVALGPAGISGGPTELRGLLDGVEA
jgi:PAS domain S-box-containing protein